MKRRFYNDVRSYFIFFSHFFFFHSSANTFSDRRLRSKVTPGHSPWIVNRRLDDTLGKNVFLSTLMSFFFFFTFPEKLSKNGAKTVECGTAVPVNEILVKSISVVQSQHQKRCARKLAIFAVHQQYLYITPTYIFSHNF